MPISHDCDAVLDSTSSRKASMMRIKTSGGSARRKPPSFLAVSRSLMLAVVTWLRRVLCGGEGERRDLSFVQAAGKQNWRE